jgi:hypothetical protein
VSAFNSSGPHGDPDCHRQPYCRANGHGEHATVIADTVGGDTRDTRCCECHADR